MDLIIKGARIVDAIQDFIGDLHIRDGKIQGLAKEINIDGAGVIEANGLTLMPSFIDTHAHFREPGLTHKEDLESGSRAALRGGFTGVCLMANTNPICSTKEVLKQIRDKAKKLDLIDVHQVVSITQGFGGDTIKHLNDFKDDKELKAISDDGVGVMNSRVMMDAMIVAKENDWVIMSHAEDKEFSKTDMRIAENLMTIRDIYLAETTGARLHMCHVSTVEALDAIRTSRLKGSNVTCEVTPHHIALTQDVSNYRVNPPIREKEDVKAVIQAIKDGVVDCIGTDHAPHTKEDKENGAPGMVGLETAFMICNTSLVQSGEISINKLSEIMSLNPANILGMNKGKLSPGYDADMVLVDLDKLQKVDSSKFHSKGKNTPFEGMEFKGEVVMTISRGKVLYKN
ncbi:MAG: dihydroorotase [Clostridium sp.]